MWSMGQNESKSGLGSSSLYTYNIINHLINIISKYNINNILDTSCGDWFWMKNLKNIFNEKMIKYTGLDIVKDICHKNNINYANNNIIFIHTDFLSYLKSLPDKSINLILCRHTCEHLKTSYILDFIKESKRVCKYLLLTTHRNATNNCDLILTDTPYRPVNLNLNPYNIFLDKYLIDSLYDGPTNQFLSEMFINLYNFNLE